MSPNRRLPRRANAPRPIRARLKEWPSDKRGREAAKWRVLIGYRLRRWRLEAALPTGATGRVQKHGAPVGLSQPTISRIESGEISVDAVALRALATLYGRDAADLAALFAPPSADEWRSIVNEHVPPKKGATPWTPPTASPLFPATRRAGHGGSSPGKKSLRDTRGDGAGT